MTAIEWIERNAVVTTTERVVLTASDTDDANEIGTYEAVTMRFGGRVSYRMAKELRLSTPKSNASTHFAMTVCMKTNFCEFFRTDYRKVS